MMSVISYVAFVVSLFIPHYFFLWYIGRSVLRDCGISWVSSHFLWAIAVEVYLLHSVTPSLDVFECWVSLSVAVDAVERVFTAWRHLFLSNILDSVLQKKLETETCVCPARIQKFWIFSIRGYISLNKPCANF